MPFNLLLLPLLGGFIFVRYWNRTRHHALRAEKERILLLASTAGVVFLFTAFLIRSLSGWLFPCSDYPEWLCVPTIWYRWIPFPYSAVSVLALLLGVVAWIPLNKGLWNWTTSLQSATTWEPITAFVKAVLIHGWSRAAELDRIIAEDGDPLDMLLRSAEKGDKTISLTLKSNKVYVGFVSQTSPPTSETRFVGILPTRSGFRNVDDKHVTYTINYSDALDDITAAIDDTKRQLYWLEFGLFQLRRGAWLNEAKLKSIRRKRTEKVRAAEDGRIRALKQSIAITQKQISESRGKIEYLETMLNDFIVVVPVSEISSVSIYREEVRDIFFSDSDATERSNDADESQTNNADLN